MSTATAMTMTPTGAAKVLPDERTSMERAVQKTVKDCVFTLQVSKT
ncbi:MAG: hypothetical protein U0166_03000 [Acidobacteriota bacterium]